MKMQKIQLQRQKVAGVFLISSSQLQKKKLAKEKKNQERDERMASLNVNSDDVLSVSQPSDSCARFAFDNRKRHHLAHPPFDTVSLSLSLSLSAYSLPRIRLLILPKRV